MSILKGIIEEERDRLIHLIDHYKNELLKLPKGSLFVRIINKKKYAYLNFRDKGKPVSKYIGKIDSEKVKELKERLKERKRIEDLLKQAKQNLKEVNRLKL